MLRGSPRTPLIANCLRLRSCTRLGGGALGAAPLSTGRRQREDRWSHQAVAGACGLAIAVAAGVAATDGPTRPNYGSGIEVDFKDPMEQHKLARQNTSRKVKNSYEYVIIGAGTTAYAAIETIFNNHPNADILLLSNEAALPQPDVFRHHSLNPPLLHSYNEWRRHITSKLESEPDAYSSAPMTVLLNKDKDMKLDIDKQRVVFEDGSYINYDRCLLATAGRPRGLWAVDRRKMSYSLRDRINTCSAIEDFHQLENIHNTMANKQVVIVGGGFLATELALALSAKGRETGMTVSQIYAEKAPLARYIPMYLAMHVQRLMHGAGIKCIAERLVTDVKEGGDGVDHEDGTSGYSSGGLKISLMGWSKETINADYAVLAPTHVDPCVEIGDKSGLEIDPVNGGIVTNQQLEAVANVFVAGGVASYYDSALGRRRVEMFDHSINSGILAGYNMSVKDKRERRRYTHQPVFRSHMKDVDVLAVGVGEINNKMRTVGVWVNNRKEKGHGGDIDYQRGIVYYLDDNRIKGILLWNTAENLERAREMLRLQPTVSSVNMLKGLIALAPETWLRVMETEPQ